MTTTLVDHNDFARMNEEMKSFDEKRDQIIKRSREILKNSKQAIYSLHRNDNISASIYLDNAEQVINVLIPLTAGNSSLRHGALSAGLEEYAEAKCLYHYLTTLTLLRLADVPNLEAEEYLGGVADFTGELVRYVIAKATKRDLNEVKCCQAMVEAIFGELIQFDFRNGPLRKKFDSVKYNLRKIENTLYELSLVHANGYKVIVDSVADDRQINDQTNE